MVRDSEHAALRSSEDFPFELCPEEAAIPRRSNHPTQRMRLRKPDRQLRLAILRLGSAYSWRFGMWDIGLRTWDCGLRIWDRGLRVSGLGSKSAIRIPTSQIAKLPSALPPRLSRIEHYLH